MGHLGQGGWSFCWGRWAERSPLQELGELAAVGEAGPAHPDVLPQAQVLHLVLDPVGGRPETLRLGAAGRGEGRAGPAGLGLCWGLFRVSTEVWDSTQPPWGLGTDGGCAPPGGQSWGQFWTLSLGN